MPHWECTMIRQLQEAGVVIFTHFMYGGLYSTPHDDLQTPQLQRPPRSGKSTVRRAGNVVVLARVRQVQGPSTLGCTAVASPHYRYQRRTGESYLLKSAVHCLAQQTVLSLSQVVGASSAAPLGKGSAAPAPLRRGASCCMGEV